MKVIVMQCFDCRFLPSLEWVVTEENFPGVYKCSQYPRKIPSYVENGSKRCPRFKTKEK